MFTVTTLEVYTVTTVEVYCNYNRGDEVLLAAGISGTENTIQVTTQVSYGL